MASAAHSAHYSISCGHPVAELGSHIFRGEIPYLQFIVEPTGSISRVEEVPFASPAVPMSLHFNTVILTPTIQYERTGHSQKLKVQSIIDLEIPLWALSRSRRRQCRLLCYRSGFASARAMRNCTSRNASSRTGQPAAAPAVGHGPASERLRAGAGGAQKRRRAAGSGGAFGGLFSVRPSFLPSVRSCVRMSSDSKEEEDFVSTMIWTSDKGFFKFMLHLSGFCVCKRSAKKYANLAKQDPGRAKQNR